MINTRFATQGNFFINSIRTSRYGLKALKVEGSKVWDAIPANIRNKLTKKSFSASYKQHLIGSYLSGDNT